MTNNVNAHNKFESISNLRRIREKVYDEKINILFKNLPVSVGASFICSTGVLYGFGHIANMSYIQPWYTAVILISLMRLTLYAWYKYRPSSSKLHFILFLMGSTASAACWGVMDSLLMPVNDQVAQMVIIIIIAGVSAGAIQTLQGSVLAALSFIAISILPLCVWLFLQNGFQYSILSIVMITYLLFITLSTLRANRMLNQALKLHFENIILVEGLYDSNNLLMKNNKLLECHEHDMMVINRMNETLQLCHNLNEAYIAIEKAAEIIFSKVNGGLTISDAFKNQQIVARWGSHQLLSSSFPSNNCWAIRSGNEYDVKDPKTELLCEHYLQVPEETCVCIPLNVHNNMLGILNFNIPEQMEDRNHTRQLMTVFGDAVKLSLANIKLYEKLQEEATHDPLTALYNRRYLSDTLLLELQRVITEDTTLCVAMFDLDYFKKFNDEYGHEAGDAVLKHVAKILVNRSRGSDIACRYGGEEFILVFINTEIEKVMPYLELIREDVKKSRIRLQDSILPQITISIGVAESPKHGVTPEVIIRSADEAMYASKQAGRDRITIARLSDQKTIVNQ